MASRLHWGRSFFAPICVASVVFGCTRSSESEPIADSVVCSPRTSAAFLRSKEDDDDGDGKFLDEAPDVNDEDDDIADHAWARGADGSFHLFFQNEDHGQGNDIEHYVSATLEELEYVGRALEADPHGWDSYGLWAPHIVLKDQVYYMFYTGTTGRGTQDAQRIGLATSTDLVHWQRMAVNNCPGTDGDGCVYDCNETWTAWDRGHDYDRQCRDPFVMWDADEKRWVLFATARSRNSFGVVSVAYSSDLVHWIGAGMIDATRRIAGSSGARATGGQAENPHVMVRRGTYYLLFTDWQDPEDDASTANPRTMVQYATASQLTADAFGSRHWTYRGPIPDPGVNAIEVQRIGAIWLMSQSIANELSGDFEHLRELRLRCVQWGRDFRFETANVEFLHPGVPRSAGPIAPEAFIDSEAP